MQCFILIVSSLTNKSGVVLKWIECIKSKGWLAVITLLSATTAVFSQQYQLSTYNLDEGLSSGLIKAIITDDVGELSYKVTLMEEGGTAEESYTTDDEDELSRNKPWTLILEPVKEGKYTITHKVGDGDEVKHEFWVRHKHHDFACKVCGRDLKVTHERLKKLFPGSSTVKTNAIINDYFKLAVEKAELNTCYRKAHFFSQIDHESHCRREYL